MRTFPKLKASDNTHFDLIKGLFPFEIIQFMASNDMLSQKSTDSTLETLLWR